MKAVKHTMTIEVNVLSVDSIPGLLEETAQSIRRENVAGMIEKDDGDNVVWDTNSGKVEF